MKKLLAAGLFLAFMTAGISASVAHPVRQDTSKVKKEKMEHMKHHKAWKHKAHKGGKKSTTAPKEGMEK